MADSDIDPGNSSLSFPLKLFALLEQEGEETTDLIKWVQHGYCFRIIDPDRFSSELVPRYFKQTKLTSFQRQLNLYGFRRIAKGQDQGCYFHPKFQRDRRDLLAEVKRLPVKGSLPSYDQFISSINNLPCEIYGSKGRRRVNQDQQKRIVIAPNSSVNSSGANPILTGTNISYTESMPNLLVSSVHGTSDRSSRLLQIPRSAVNVTLSTNSNLAPSIASTTIAAPKTMSKLTMNIGYGRNVFPSTSSSQSSFAVATNSLYPGGIRYSTTLPVVGRNAYVRPSTLPNEISQPSQVATLENYSYVPFSSNFSAETLSAKDFCAKDPSNEMFFSELNSQIFHSQGSTEDSSYHAVPFADELDMLDLFSGDIPQSVHGTPSNGGLSPAAT